MLILMEKAVSMPSLLVLVVVVVEEEEEAVSATGVLCRTVRLRRDSSSTSMKSLCKSKKKKVEEVKRLTFGPLWKR